MHKVTQSTTALGRVIDLTADAVIEVSSDRVVESSSEFKAGGRVWVKRLNQVGVVQEVRRGSCGPSSTTWFAQPSKGPGGSA